MGIPQAPPPPLPPTMAMVNLAIQTSDVSVHNLRDCNEFRLTLKNKSHYHL